MPPSGVLELMSYGLDEQELAPAAPKEVAIHHHSSPDDTLRKFLSISQELEALSGRKARREREQKLKEERERKEREDALAASLAAAQGRLLPMPRKNASRFKSMPIPDGLETPRPPAQSLNRARTSMLSESGEEHADKAAELKASLRAQGLGETNISGAGLSEMEERLLTACDPEGLSPKVISLAGRETEAMLLTGYQGILAYFRHKSMLADLGDHFERMRHAAMMGDEGAIHELAQDHNQPGVTSESTPPAQPRKTRKAIHARVAHPPGHDAGDRAHSRGDHPKSKEWAKARLPMLTRRLLEKTDKPTEGNSAGGVNQASMHASQALHKAGLGRLVRRSTQLEGASTLLPPGGSRKSRMSTSRSSSKYHSEMSSRYHSEIPEEG